MSSQRRWWLGALGSMIALAAIGSWGCCSVTCCDKKPRNQLVLVSAADAVQPEDIAISWSARQEIVWKLQRGSTIAYVEIQLEGKPKPFDMCDMSTAGLCKISCRSGLCPSGPIDAALPKPKEKPYPYYKYGFHHLDSSASADPGFRIDP
jgi:hypothetical protein